MKNWKIYLGDRHNMNFQKSSISDYFFFFFFPKKEPRTCHVFAKNVFCNFIQKLGKTSMQHKMRTKLNLELKFSGNSHLINISWHTKFQQVLMCWPRKVWFTWHGMTLYQYSLLSISRKRLFYLHETLHSCSWKLKLSLSSAYGFCFKILWLVYEIMTLIILHLDWF